MKKRYLLWLVLTSIFVCNVQASLSPQPKTDMQKMDDLKALFRNERFPKGCLDLEAAILVSTIADPETRMSATLLVHSAQIKGLRAEMKKKQNACCAVQ